MSTDNLRGLGSARTLTLLNGKRHVPTETTGVDISARPFSAVRRMEALKDRAAALALGGHRLTYVMHYVDSYTDERSSTLPALRKIDSHVSHDLHYNWSLLNDDLLVSVSAINVTDESPPRAQLDVNYDPFTHNPFGRMVKLGVRYNFGGR